MMPVCFVDMDGVLVDFVTGACRTHGSTLYLEPHLVSWGFPTQIWAGLGWTPEGKDLLAGVEALVGAESIALMTSPCDTPGSVEGKVEWVRRNLPAYRRRLFVGPAKHLAAGPAKILVDDHDANVDKFRAHGGAAVQPPRPWNRRQDECLPGGRFNVPGVLFDLKALLDG
jgi:hypothetical protein